MVSKEPKDKTLYIRPLLDFDEEQVQRIELEEFYPDENGQPIGFIGVNALRQQKNFYVIVAESITEKFGRSVCGYAVYSLHGGEACLHRIVSVLKRSGIGTVLLNEVVERTEQRGCEMLNTLVQDSDVTSLAFFNSHGFTRQEIDEEDPHVDNHTFLQLFY